MKLKILVFTGIVYVVILHLSIASAQGVTSRIMPLGDSITSGSGEFTNSDDKVGYRQFLWQGLNNLGYDVDFVGSLSSGSNTVPTFDIDHEGHGGYTSADVAANVYGWLAANQADIVLLHIGTNDIGNVTIPIIVNTIDDILDSIYDYSSDIVVILAQIINQKTPLYQITQLNDQLKALADSREAAGDPIVLVDMENALVYPDDMWDVEHPNSSGYAKMADRWLSKLDAIFRPQVLLVTEKTGLGVGNVTSVPAAVDCGDVCSAYFDQGTVVTITAAADYGSVFSDWYGCNEFNGNTCTVTMNTDLTVTARFRTVTDVKILSLNGGEVIPAGSPQYPITWEAPSDAVKFVLSYHPGRRIGTVYSVNSILWDAPLLKKNRTNTYVKITAYNSANRKIGYDISDSVFTIEVVSITSPNQESPCTGGQSCPITWTKSEYVPAASIELYYSLSNGHGWKKILDTPLSGDAKSFDWIAPEVTEPITKCKVRIVLRDSRGKVVGRHISEGNFTIQPSL